MNAISVPLRRTVVPLGWILASLALAGCTAQPDSIPVIGYGFSNGHLGRVVEGLMARDGIEVSFVYDSTSVGDGVAADLARSEIFAAMPDLVGVVGHAGSGGSLIAAITYNSVGIPNLVPNATSRRLTDAGPWVFQVAPNDSIEGLFIAGHIDEVLTARSVVVFYVAEEYGHGLATGVVAGLEARSVAVRRVPVRVPASAVTGGVNPDYASLLESALMEGVPDVVVLAVRGFVADEIIPRLIEIAPGIRIVGGDALYPHDRLARLLHGTEARMEVVDFWDPEADDSRSEEFRALFRETVGRDPSGADAIRFDALMLMARAVHEAGADRDAVRAYLEGLGRTQPPYRGITGDIRFDINDGSALVMLAVGGVDR